MASGSNRDMSHLAAATSGDVMSTEYLAWRDTADSRASDETRAMCHVVIYRGPDLAEARLELRRYVEREIAWLRSKGSDERADELAAVLPDLGTLSLPDTDSRLKLTRVEAAGLLWTITSVNR